MKKLIAICACALFAIGLTACGSSSDNGTSSTPGEVTFSSVETAVFESIVDFLEAEGVVPGETDGQITGFATYDLATGEVLGLYPTLDPSLFVNGTMYMPLIMVNGDLVIVAEAADADALATIETAFEGVKDVQIQTWSTYLPEQYAKVQDNQIVTSGNYILYSTFDNDVVVKAFNEATK